MTVSILVAGGAGYIGAHVCKALAAAGYRPVVLDNFATGHRDFVRFGPLVEACVSDVAAVSAAIREYGIIAAIDLAGSIEVAESVADPQKYYDNNVARKIPFLQALREGGVHAVVFSSSAAVYGEPQAIPIPEMHPCAPKNPYGDSKLQAEQLLQEQYAAGGIPWMALRYFNAAGTSPDGDIGEAHQPETHLIPRACMAVLGKIPALEIFGNDYPTPDGTAMRDYIHVMDLAAAHVCAVEALLRGAPPAIYNLGTGQGTSIAELLRSFETLGWPVPHHFAARREGDPAQLVADASAAHTALNWQPAHTLSDIIRSAYHWHAARMNAPEAEKLSVLMLSTDPRVLGGITNFTTTLMAHASRTEFTLLPLGSVTDQVGGGVREGSIARLRRLFTMPKRVALLAESATVLHLNTPFNVKGLMRDGLILRALPIEKRRTLLLYFHGWSERTARVILRIPPLCTMLQRLLREVGSILVLAPEFKEQLVAMGVAAERITVTRTMFDATFLKDAKPLAIHTKKPRYRVLFMSRFVREKGIDELLDAFTRIALDYPDVDFVLAGDGPEYRRITEQAAKLSRSLRSRLEFPGYVGGEQKAALLAGCNIFALPTYYPEGMPVALLEAMAAGKPVLTNNIGGIKEVVSDPENGVLLSSVSVETVENGLRRLLDDPAYCERVGAQNAIYAWSTFEAHIVTAEIEAIYYQLAGR